MKKEDVTGLIVWVLLVACAVVFYIAVLREYYESAQGFSGVFTYMLFFVGAMLTGILVNAIAFELAHMLGAKLGGYVIMSVNILGLMFYKDEKKVKVRFSSYDGLTGETKIYPKPNAKKEPNPTPFLLMGTIFFAIIIFGCVFAYNLMKTSDDSWVKNFAYFILTAGVTGAIVLVYNIIPLRLDNLTDGYRLRLVSSSKNRKAFNDLLREENGIAITTSETTEEVKAEEKEEEEDDDSTAFSADLALNKVYKKLEKRDFVKAEEILDTVLASNNVAKKVWIRAKAQKIYLNLMYKTDEEANLFYEEQVPIAERREIAEDSSMACIRAYILMSGLMDKSKSECVYAINKVKKAMKHSLDTRKEVEKTLFNEAIDKINEAHPKWELNQYKL